MFPDRFTLHLATTNADAEHFHRAQKIEAKYFGRTSNNKEHITLTEDVSGSIIEHMTVANAITINAVHNSSTWWVFKIMLDANDFGNFVRAGVLEFWNKNKGVWRWWGDIDMKMVKFCWCMTSTQFPLDLDTWAAKMLSQYKRVILDDRVGCDGCDMKTNAFWQGTHDFTNRRYCVRCWFNYLMERNGNSAGRVDSYNMNKRKLEMDASTDDASGKAARSTIKLDYVSSEDEYNHHHRHSPSAI